MKASTTLANPGDAQWDPIFSFLLKSALVGGRRPQQEILDSPLSYLITSPQWMSHNIYNGTKTAKPIHCEVFSLFLVCVPMCSNFKRNSLGDIVCYFRAEIKYKQSNMPLQRRKERKQRIKKELKKGKENLKKVNR